MTSRRTRCSADAYGFSSRRRVTAPERMRCCSRPLPPSRPGTSSVDVGAGTGAVGLMAAARARVRVVLRRAGPGARGAVPEELGAQRPRRRSCRRRHPRPGLAAIRRAFRQLSADCVLTNPPFLEEGRARRSPDAGRAAAHVLPADGLDAWVKACAGLLKHNGRFVLVHRADRVGDCLAALGKGSARSICASCIRRRTSRRRACS